VLARKYNSNSARRRIFDGAAEAKLIALTISFDPIEAGLRERVRELIQAMFEGSTRAARSQ
jgi:hypothetical protein